MNKKEVLELLLDIFSEVEVVDVEDYSGSAQVPEIESLLSEIIRRIQEEALKDD